MDMFLFIVGVLGFLIGLILLIARIIKKKPKKKALITMGVCFVLVFVGLFMPNSNSDGEESASNIATEAEEDAEKKEDLKEEEVDSINLTEDEKVLLTKSFDELEYEETLAFSSILYKFNDIPEDEQNEYSDDIERMKLEREEWQKEQDRIAAEKEAKEWEEFVSSNTKTLSAGEHFAGEHIASGMYDVTFNNNGNFSIHGSDGSLITNEIGGSNGITKYRAILPEESIIKLSGLSATFTPVKRVKLSYDNLELYAGYWYVDIDLSSGRYKVTTNNEDLGNFVVYSSKGRVKTNEILGGPYGVDEVVVNLDEGDLIQISSLKSVNFMPEK